MTTSRQSLASWLLERITEDEATVLSGECRCEDGEPQRPDCAARVLAECETKRRIVQRAVDLIASFGDWDAPAAEASGGRKLWTDVNRRERAHAHDLLAMLAVPYADRPGFDERWKP